MFSLKRHKINFMSSGLSFYRFCRNTEFSIFGQIIGLSTLWTTFSDFFIEKVNYPLVGRNIDFWSRAVLSPEGRCVAFSVGQLRLFPFIVLVYVCWTSKTYNIYRFFLLQNILSPEGRYVVSHQGSICFYLCFILRRESASQTLKGSNCFYL